MESLLYVSALLVIAVTCLLGVFYHDFADNLIQRIGLSMACLGATVRIWDLIAQSPNDTRARYLFTYGLAIYCIGTVIKLWRKAG